MAKQKAGGLKKRRRTPSESAAQRNRSFRNKDQQRKEHMLRHPNDIASVKNVSRWTPESQKVQKTNFDSSKLLNKK